MQNIHRDNRQMVRKYSKKKKKIELPTLKKNIQFDRSNEI